MDHCCLMSSISWCLIKIQISLDLARQTKMTRSFYLFRNFQDNFMLIKLSFGGCERDLRCSKLCYEAWFNDYFRFCCILSSHLYTWSSISPLRWHHESSSVFVRQSGIPRNKLLHRIHFHRGWGFELNACLSSLISKNKQNKNNK